MPDTTPMMAAWAPWTSRTWVANSPPAPNMPTNPSRIGVIEVPPMSKPNPSRSPPRMSSNTTVISSSTPPTRAATAKTQSSTGIVIIRGRPTLPWRHRCAAPRGRARTGRRAPAAQHRAPDRPRKGRSSRRAGGPLSLRALGPETSAGSPPGPNRSCSHDSSGLGAVHRGPETDGGGAGGVGGERRARRPPARTGSRAACPAGTRAPAARCTPGAG